MQPNKPSGNQVNQTLWQRSFHLEIFVAFQCEIVYIGLKCKLSHAIE